MWYFGSDEDGDEFPEEEKTPRKPTVPPVSGPPPGGTDSDGPSSPTRPWVEGSVPAPSPRTVPVGGTTVKAPLQERKILSDFLSSHKCYDLVPVSGKIVVLDTELPVKAAFFGLIENGVTSAPLWDSSQNCYIGMITVSDFRNILRQFHKSPDRQLAKELEEHKIRTWREIMAPRSSAKPASLICIEPEESLLDAVKILLKSRFHRLPVLDKANNTILYIITHRKINRFLVKNLQQHPSILECTIGELGIGTYANVATVSKDTPLYQVLDLLAEREISAVPIVGDNGEVLDVYCNSDVTNIAKYRQYDDLDKPVKDSLNRKRGGVNAPLHTCYKTETLWAVLNRFVETKVHRLVCVDDQMKVAGIVSLSDILKFAVFEE